MDFITIITSFGTEIHHCKFAASDLTMAFVVSDKKSMRDADIAEVRGNTRVRWHVRTKFTATVSLTATTFLFLSKYLGLVRNLFFIYNKVFILLTEHFINC